jgi:hypothetical protein
VLDLELVQAPRAATGVQGAEQLGAGRVGYVPQHQAALPARIEHYNNTRPHTGIDNRPPRQALNNLTGNNC